MSRFPFGFTTTDFVDEPTQSFLDDPLSPPPSIHHDKTYTIIVVDEVPEEEFTFRDPADLSLNPSQLDTIRRHHEDDTVRIPNQSLPIILEHIEPAENHSFIRLDEHPSLRLCLNDCRVVRDWQSSFATSDDTSISQTLAPLTSKNSIRLNEYIQLRQMNRRSKGCVLPESHVRHIATQLITELKNLHDGRNTHSNVQPSNVIVHLDGKIELVSSETSNQRYFSPEHFQSNYGIQVDVWGLGTILYECCAGLVSNFKPSDFTNTLSEYSPECLDFILSCLERDPFERPTARELASFPFITSTNELVHDDLFVDAVTVFVAYLKQTNTCATDEQVAGLISLARHRISANEIRCLIDDLVNDRV